MPHPDTSISIAQASALRGIARTDARRPMVEQAAADLERLLVGMRITNLEAWAACDLLRWQLQEKIYGEK